MYDYWLKQTAEKPLFPDIEWQKPEQKSMSGKLLIIGGNSHNFAAVSTSYSDALKAGAGQVKAVLPDSLKKTIDGGNFDCVFVQANQSGGISKESLNELKAAAEWADALLFIGDAGRNSETAIVYEQLINASSKINLITRDSLDLLKANWPELVQKENSIIIASLAQLQKIFMSVYYPKVILFSMQLTNLVEAMHKFTLTYPLTIVVYHQGQIIVARGGQVSTTPFENPNLIWRGSVATKAAVYAMQNSNKIFEAISASLI